MNKSRYPCPTRTKKTTGLWTFDSSNKPKFVRWAGAGEPFVVLDENLVDAEDMFWPLIQVLGRDGRVGFLSTNREENVLEEL